MKNFFVLLFLFIGYSLCAFELKNFSSNNIDYQWDRKDKQEEALSVYVTGFQYTYRQLGLGDCAEHFKNQVIEEQLLSDQDPQNNRWLVAMDGDKVVGMAIFEFNNYPHIYIRELSVLPEYRRRGVGTELCLNLLRNNDVERISILTRRANQPAVDFYRSLNFQETDFQHTGYDSERYIGMEWVAQE
jgi:ribosomal protein S18 acetylase RimI-like enzyme